MVQIALKHVKEEGVALKCVQVALGLVIDPEVRVRLAVGECLAGATAQLGPRVWEAAATPLLKVIEYCWVIRPPLPPPPQRPPLFSPLSPLCLSPHFLASNST